MDARIPAARGWKRALVGACLSAMALSACGDGNKTGSGSSSSPPPQAGAVGRNAPSCGWIPANAKEATSVSSLQGGHASDPLCADAGSPLDVPTAILGGYEAKLREATQISDAEEKRIGAKMEAALPRERTFAGKLDLPEDVQRYGGYLRDIVQHLAAGSTRPGIQWHVHVARIPVFNAAALPGGVLLVFTGTLEGREAVHSEAELAAVLGHEMAHVERRHVVAAYQYAKAALGENTDEAVLVMRILTQPLSVQHELEADDRGTELAVLAQYNPQAVVDLWKRNARTERHARPAGGPGGVLGEVLEGLETVLRSHPPAAVRACHAMDKVVWARQHTKCDRVYDGRSNVAKHVAGPRHPF